MSGGSLDYAYSKIEEAAIIINTRAKTPLRKAFAKHLWLVSKALKELEWVMSGDNPEGYEVESMKAVVSPQMELQAAIENAIEARRQLEEILEVVNG